MSLARIAIAFILAAVASMQPPATLAIGEEELADAIRFREEFGFRSDIAFVAAIEADEKHSDLEWGVRLTADEHAEMERRVSAEALLGPLDQWGRENPSQFAGMYIDQRAGFVIDIAFTADAAIPEYELQGLAPPGIPIRYRIVERTLQELDALLETVAKDSEFHERLGVELVFIATDVPDNVVEIGLSPLTDVVADALAERYGRGIELFRTEAASTTACTGRYTCTPPPMRAGTALKRNNQNYTCTAGFAAWKWVPGPDIDYIQITAGHCGAVGQAFTHNGVAVGTMLAEVWGPETTADAGWVTLNDSWAWPNVYASPSGYYPIYSVQGQNADFIGQSVCLSGIQIGNSCGTILNDNARVNLSPGIWSNKQRTASYAVDTVNGGDSGGPVRANSVAVGIQSGYINNPVRSVSSHIWEVETRLGITVYEH
jgi:hypothetical protein